MTKITVFKKDYVTELVKIIRNAKNAQVFQKHLANYHDKDVAEAITRLNETERMQLYTMIGTPRLAEIFSYLDDAKLYLDELSLDKAARVISDMDADDALDILDELSAEQQQEMVARLDDDSRRDVKKLLSYENDEIGSCMTNNYICIPDTLSIREAMSTLVRQAGEHDNISTIYTTDINGQFSGAIDLKDLIIARENDSLSNIISHSYPSVYEHVKIADCIEDLTDYEEDSIPVLSENGTIAGILTANDIVELVDNAMGDDYAKLAGLTSEEDLNEPTFTSMKKRLPWLIILLFLGMAVSSVVGMFESVVAVLPIVICFQSLVLDMAGNVGTQSLAVTIRVLMDEDLSTKKKLSLLIKEMKIGFLNGASLGIMALLFLGIYIHYFKKYIWASAFLISGCVGISLIVAMVISSFVGTIIPMFFHKIHIDPAVASGPLITTVNDLVAVITYYGLAMVFLINIFHIYVLNLHRSGKRQVVFYNRNHFSFARTFLHRVSVFFYRNFFTSCFYFLLPELFYTRFLFHILDISNILLKSYAFPLYMHQRSEQTAHCNDGICNNRWCAHLPSQP